MEEQTDERTTGLRELDNMNKYIFDLFKERKYYVLHKNKKIKTLFLHNIKI